MRTIKFRGKRIDNGEWAFGSLDMTYGNANISWEFYPPESPDETVGWVCGVENETVGEFTGILDKNGKEIYEGDIVRFYDDIEDELISAPVIYHADTCSFCAQPQSSDPVGITAFWQFEVIGNIHDNTELLKGGNNEND